MASSAETLNVNVDRLWKTIGKPLATIDALESAEEVALRIAQNNKFKPNEIALLILLAADRLVLRETGL